MGFKVSNETLDEFDLDLRVSYEENSPAVLDSVDVPPGSPACSGACTSAAC
jgi:hypothetical protein